MKGNKYKAWTKEEHNLVKKAVVDAKPDQTLKEIFTSMEGVLEGRTVASLCSYYSRVVSLYPNFEDVPKRKRVVKNHAKNLKARTTEQKIEDHSTQIQQVSKTEQNLQQTSNEEKLKRRLERVVALMTPEQKDDLLKRMLMD